MFGFDAVHAHIGRELWTRDYDGRVFVEPQQAEKLLGRLDISYHNGDVVEVFDHGLWLLSSAGTKAVIPQSNRHRGAPRPTIKKTSSVSHAFFAAYFSIR